MDQGTNVECLTALSYEYMSLNLWRIAAQNGCGIFFLYECGSMDQSVDKGCQTFLSSEVISQVVDKGGFTSLGYATVWMW